MRDDLRQRTALVSFDATSTRLRRPLVSFEYDVVHPNRIWQPYVRKLAYMF